MVYLAQELKAKVPPGYRACIGRSPVVATDDPPGEPDVSVRDGRAPAIPAPQ